MNKKTLAALVIVLFAGAGCVRTDYPRATLASAFDAIQKGNLAEFQQTLSPELAKTLGSVEAMQKLHAEFSSYSSVDFGDEILIKEMPGSQPAGVFGDFYRLYSEQIMEKTADAKDVLLHTATVTCHVTRSIRPAPGSDPSAPSQVVENQDCFISELK